MTDTNSPRTLILMCDNRDPGKDLTSYISLAAYGNYKYAQANGYTFIYVKPCDSSGSPSPRCCRNPSTGAARFVAWAKIIATHHMLSKYDRVVYIDSDAFFNTTTSIDKFLKKYIVDDKGVFFCNDHPFNPNKPNTGFFICDNSRNTQEFLRSWYCYPHNEPKFDTEGTWEQASLFSWNLTNLELAKYYHTLPVNQFKLKNFKTGYAWQSFRNTEEDDVVGNRLIINHYFMKKPEEMRNDLLKLYSMEDFEEVLTAVDTHSIRLNAEDYTFNQDISLPDITKVQPLSVVISGSYLESHPEITFMKEVIESLELTGISYDTPILLSHDKIKPGAEGFEEKEKTYNKYFENLQAYIDTSKFKNIETVKALEWGHLTRSLKNAVSKVKTKYILVLQHDIHIHREIPVLDMIALMEKNEHIKHLRFNVRRNHPTFMWWDGYKGGKHQFAEEEVDGVKLCFTPAWSDQNHLATKEYYENVVFPDCSNADGELIYDFMENRLNGLCHHNHERYGTYIYGEYGAPRTSRHSDGRKSSPEADED